MVYTPVGRFAGNIFLWECCIMSMFLVFLADLGDVFSDLSENPISDVVDWRNYDVYTVYVMATNQIDARNIAEREFYSNLSCLSNKGVVRAVGCVHIHED